VASDLPVYLIFLTSYRQFIQPVDVVKHMHYDQDEGLMKFIFLILNHCVLTY
jgi:hypothetical protein